MTCQGSVAQLGCAEGYEAVGGDAEFKCGLARRSRWCGMQLALQPLQPRHRSNDKQRCLAIWQWCWVEPGPASPGACTTARSQLKGQRLRCGKVVEHLGILGFHNVQTPLIHSQMLLEGTALNRHLPMGLASCSLQEGISTAPSARREDFPQINLVHYPDWRC